MTSRSSTTAPASTPAPGVSVSREQTTMAELSEVLSKLIAVAPALNQATDATNEAFRAAETVLGALIWVSTHP